MHTQLAARKICFPARNSPAIAAVAAAAVLLARSGFGLCHSRQISPNVEVLTHLTSPEPGLIHS